MLRTGSQLPYSPLLPMPPPPSEAELGPAFNAVNTPKAQESSAPRYPTATADEGAKAAPGMIRSYSVPVATQAEYEEHQRTFVRTGCAGAGYPRLQTTQFEIPAWHHTFAMSTSTSASSSSSTSSPLSRSTARYNNTTSPSIKPSSSPPRSFAARSPLSPISPNLPIVYQQDVEMPLGEARWAATTLRPAPLLEDAAEDAANISGFSLCSSSADLSRASDMSDEARTPRASSPAAFQHTQLTTDPTTTTTIQNKQLQAWPSVLDFIHPDHLA